jgi:hypothetical protein|tara:strand:- start:273 stop:980 length:708 start_codon:yes stop_codon:yes gene_type:complete
MPTHFSSGVSNRTNGHPLFEFPYLDPFKYYIYSNDFFTYHADEFTITTTEGGSGDASEALTSLAGGALLITNDDADNDHDFFQLKGESFKYSSTKNMFFKARFKVSDATQSDIVMGLQITDTSPLATTDGIFFQKDDGDANLDFHIEKDSTQTDNTAISTLSDDTFVDVAFHYDPKGNLGSGSFKIYVDDALVATQTTLTNVPDNEELTVSFGIQNGAAAAKTMTVDYIMAAVER